MKLYKKNDAGLFVEVTDTEIRQAHVKIDGLIDVFWGVEDIVTCADMFDMVLTVGQINRVIKNIEENHDANNGLNWDAVLGWIQYTLSKLELKIAKKMYDDLPEANEEF